MLPAPRRHLGQPTKEDFRLGHRLRHPTKATALTRRLGWVMAGHSPAEYLRAWRKAHPDRVRAHARAAYKRLDPEHLRARWIVKAAIRSGKLVRPDRCEECGATPGTDERGRSLVEAHHPDHARPLAVEWLCKRPCHARRHGRAA